MPKRRILRSFGVRCLSTKSAASSKFATSASANDYSTMHVWLINQRCSESKTGTSGRQTLSLRTVPTRTL